MILSATVSSGVPFHATLFILLIYLYRLALLAGSIYVFILLVKALRKYLKSGEVRKEKSAVCKSLGEALKEE